MKINSILLIPAAALLLLACTKDPAFPGAGSITVEAGIGTMTKVTTDGVASSFETGDRIAVYAWTGSAAAVPAERVVDGVVNTLGSDGKWTPASQMRWKVGTDAHYFLGVSPVRAVSDFTADAVTLSGDYATDDLLFARNLDGLKPSTTPVALSFAHAMARLTVNLKVRNEFGASPAVTVAVTAKSGATVNYLTQAVTATGDASAQSLTAAASAPTGYTHSFVGIQVPQEGVRTITITVAGQNYVYEAGEDIPLTSGHHTTLGLIVGKDKLELSGVSVSDWTAGSAIAGGEAAVTLINGHEFVNLGNGLLWATCNVGAENPWDYGDYFAWGATVPFYQEGYSQESPCVHWIDGKSRYNLENAPFLVTGSPVYSITKYTYADNVLEFNVRPNWYDGDTFKGDNGDGVEHKDFASYDYVDDAARANWGGEWRTPTNIEWTWLRENCTWMWTTQNGVNGYVVTGNGHSIFLPAAGYRGGDELLKAGSDGYYWSSSLSSRSSWDVGLVEFHSDYIIRAHDVRWWGQSIRPVLGTPTPDPRLGDLYYSDGTWSSTLVAGKTPIGVIAYLDEPATYDDGITERGNGGGHGLVLCLKNAASNVRWSTEIVLKFPGQEVSDGDGLTRLTNVSGYTNTAMLMADAETAAKYPAAAAARNYSDLPTPAGTTGWFLPSAQQWVMMMEGLGGLAEDDIIWDSWFDANHTAADKWETAMAKAGAKGTAYDSMTDNYLWYWSSSESTYVEAVSLGIDATSTGAGCGFFFDSDEKFPDYSLCSVRPVLAF